MRFLKRSFFQRLMGRCATAELSDARCWMYSDGRLEIDLARTPELAAPSGAIRLEGKGLPSRVLVVHCDDDQYRAVLNACTHGGRRLDPVPGDHTFQCCSVGRSTFDYQGRALSGPAKVSIKLFAAKRSDGKLVVSV